MERKSKVTQAAVNAACEQLHAEGKNTTVNAVISICGGSFSTVGAMVKAWKEEHAAHSAPLMEMPENVNHAALKAAADIWGAASSLAGEAVERIQKEAGEAISKAKAELSEYAGEVTRLENEIEQAQMKIHDLHKNLHDETEKAVHLTTQNAALETRLADRDCELERLRSDYDKLQAELITIAKAQAETTKKASKKQAE